MNIRCWLPLILALGCLSVGCDDGYVLCSELGSQSPYELLGEKSEWLPCENFGEHCEFKVQRCRSDDPFLWDMLKCNCFEDGWGCFTGCECEGHSFDNEEPDTGPCRDGAHCYRSGTCLAGPQNLPCPTFRDCTCVDGLWECEHDFCDCSAY